MQNPQHRNLPAGEMHYLKLSSLMRSTLARIDEKSEEIAYEIRKLEKLESSQDSVHLVGVLLLGAFFNKLLWKCFSPRNFRYMKFIL